jgi:death-on-curing protein
MISVDYIKGLNSFLLHNASCNEDLLSSALSSHYYYDDIHDKVTSIVRGIVKNHPFTDGNKRTAVAVLFTLSYENNLILKDDDLLEDIIVHIADTSLDIETISSLIYK